ncbi:hypothetical protein BTO28_12105 [Domibacillus epiphyticus]|uniref:Cyclic lactone autoinducer peptide n=1 Tax=Domibacillus epiphyticus TaxID=1714355 RepID=A0A1V2A6A6_9BACI|nr:hypothetical protein BTO28_12105 [Domibacillus epiphyticus]
MVGVIASVIVLIAKAEISSASSLIFYQPTLPEKQD